MGNQPDVPKPSRRAEVARLELSRLPPDTPLGQVFRAACEWSADALDVDRVGVWLLIDDQASLRCAHLYERSTGEHSSGTILHVADFPTYFKSLNIRKAIPAEIAATEPWTAELAAGYMRPLGVSSMLDAGIFVDGGLVGVVCHEHVGPPREWTTEARDFAGSVADLVALRIQSAAAREHRAAFLTQQERLAGHAKAAALEQIAAGLVHDFRNLLTVILGYGEYFRDHAGLAAADRDKGKAMVTAAERAIDTVQELLEFARPKVGPPAVVDLGDLTDKFLSVLRSAAGPRHQVQFARSSSAGQVLIEKNRYTRLLLNLVLNARDAMPGGGTIQVRLAPVKVSGGTAEAERFVLVEVTDAGAGMDEATRRRAFDPFFTTKQHGTGLGLAVVRQIMDRVGGKIQVESAVGTGTTFRLLFPRIGASTGGTTEFAVPPGLRPS